MTTKSTIEINQKLLFEKKVSMHELVDAHLNTIKNYDGVLNSTRQINCSVADFDTYRTNNCLNTKTCNYPVSLSVGSSGQIGINSINFTQSLEAKPNITSEITISNLTRYENMSLFNFTLRKVIDGVVNLYGFDFEFKGSKNITLFAHSQENDTNLLGTSN